VLLPKLPEERMTIRAAAPGQPWDGRSDMVILRLASQNRMVTKGYRKGVYDWVRCSRCRANTLKLVVSHFRNSSQARAAATNINRRITSSKGLGSLRRIFHATKLIDDSLRLGSPRMNLSAREEAGLKIWIFLNARILGESSTARKCS